MVTAWPHSGGQSPVLRTLCCHQSSLTRNYNLATQPRISTFIFFLLVTAAVWHPDYRSLDKFLYIFLSLGPILHQKYTEN